VSGAIGRAIAEIRGHLPQLADHLDTCLRVRRQVRYQPDRRISWNT
jgi:hypothetical protein